MLLNTHFIITCYQHCKLSHTCICVKIFLTLSITTVDRISWLDPDMMNMGCLYVTPKGYNKQQLWFIFVPSS